MRSEKHLVIRADADPKMGTGHVMRCLAWGQAWKDAGGKVVFITACANGQVLQHVYPEGFTVHRLERPYPDDGDWEVTNAILADHPGAWLVLDGYHFDSDYQRLVKKAGYRLMVIDDMAHPPHYYGDIVLNQNIHAKSLCYSCEPYTKLLLGTQYVLLRREFLKWQGWKREIPEIARRVLVTLGGSDPENVTLKVVQALQHLKIDGLEAVIVSGACGPHYAELQSAVRPSKLPMRLESNVTNMPDLMAWADVAVSAGGSTCWEMAFMGLPSLALVLAANQRPIVERLDTVGVAVNLGWYETLVPAEITQELTRLLVAAEMRAEMARKGQGLVDGEGDRRALMCVEGRRVRLRPVYEDDCKLLWEWANDPDVRASAFETDSIRWEEHLAWFSRKRADPSCQMFIVVDSNDFPVGQVRFDIQPNGTAEVDISIAREQRERGYGAEALQLACARLFRTASVKRIISHIKPENMASIRAFEKVGFVGRGRETIKGGEAISLRLERP